MKFLGITQARSGSSRLPLKVLKTINKQTLLEIHLLRLKQSRMLSKIILATTTNQSDDLIEQIGGKMGIEVYRGSEDDVLDRYYQTWKSQEEEYQYVVRFTSDCPLIDPLLVDLILEEAELKDLDYYSNTIEESFPDGQDIEVIKSSALVSSWQDAERRIEREHVTQHIIHNSNLKGKKKFKAGFCKSDVNYGDVRLTVDEAADYAVVKKLVQDLGIWSSWQDYTSYYKGNNLSDLNAHIQRNEGLKNSPTDN